MELTAHNIVLQNHTRLANGRAQFVVHLTFYVGDHGPFQHDFVSPQNTPADIQAYIQQTVTDLRAIVNRAY